MLSYHFILGIYPMWLWCIIVNRLLYLFCSHFKVFLDLYSGEVFFSNSLSSWCFFVSFSYQDNVGLMLWRRNDFLLFCFFLGRLWEELVLTMQSQTGLKQLRMHACFKLLLELASEVILSWTFYYWEGFDYRRNSLTFYRCSHILYFFSWVSFGNLCVSRNVCFSSKLSNLLTYNCSWY